MTKEQLMALGMTEAQADAALKIYKESLDGNFVAKHRFDEVNGELKTAKEQVAQRDTQIAGLKKFEGDSAALTEKIKTLETENTTKGAEYQKSLELERTKNAIKFALVEDANGKPHDVDMVMGLFNLEQVKIDPATGKVTSGYQEQSDNLRKEKAFLFSPKAAAKPPEPIGAGWKPKGTPPADGSGGGQGDPSETYGKSLAQIKLGMMGIKPATETKTN